MTENPLDILSPLYTDLYQLKMAQGYFFTRFHKKPAVFDLHYRSNPFQGGYVVAAGISEVTRLLERLRFSKSDLAFLKQQGFESSFLKYLAKFRFSFNVDGVREGEVVFPREPILRVEGGLLECQLAETVLINFIHFSSLVATKATRIVQAAEGRQVIEFGLRRAQGPAGLLASRAAFLGGADGTSNVMAGKLYRIPVFGTQAHSWIQAFRNEEEAFLKYARLYRNKTTLLIDTYNTLENGLPNVIRAARRLKREGIEIGFVRLDSGDLSYLSKKVRQGLDEAGFSNVRIIASGNLDEQIIASLLKQEAKIDAFGVGTKLVTSYEEPALDMIYKLSQIDHHPEIKISDSVEKMNEPGRKKVWRYLGPEGNFLLDAVVLEGEKGLREVYHPFYKFSRTCVARLRHEEVFHPIMRKGRVVARREELAETREYVKKRLSRLPSEHRRFTYPHVYRVGVSPKLFRMKESLILRRRVHR